MKQTHDIVDVFRFTPRTAVRGYTCTDTTLPEAIAKIKKREPHRQHFIIERKWGGAQKTKRGGSEVINTYVIIALPIEGETDANRNAANTAVQNDLGSQTNNREGSNGN